MRRRSLRSVLLTTIATIVIGVHGARVLGLPPEPEFLTPLLGEQWTAGMVVIQPDIDPERPLQPLFYTRTTAASGGASAIFYDVGVAAEWRSDAQET